MINVRITMKGTHEPLKRIRVSLRLDATGEVLDTSTDREGVAVFDAEPTSGKILVAGVPRYHGRLDKDIDIELWSLMGTGSVSETGAPGGTTSGNTAYPGMQTRVLDIGDREVMTDSEGYLVDLDDWSEAFVHAEAGYEGLELTGEHWEVIRFLRDYYEQHRVQASVREVIKHFSKVWGRDKGSNRYLHEIFPRGGPQKQGNRLAGLMRTKGEH